MHVVVAESTMRDFCTLHNKFPGITVYIAEPHKPRLSLQERQSPPLNHFSLFAAPSVVIKMGDVLTFEEQ